MLRNGTSRLIGPIPRGGKNVRNEIRDGFTQVDKHLQPFLVEIVPHYAIHEVRLQRLGRRLSALRIRFEWKQRLRHPLGKNGCKHKRPARSAPALSGETTRLAMLFKHLFDGSSAQPFDLAPLVRLDRPCCQRKRFAKQPGHRDPARHNPFCFFEARTTRPQPSAQLRKPPQSASRKTTSSDAPPSAGSTAARISHDTAGTATASPNA